MHIALLEDCYPGRPCAEVELTPLKQCIYKMLLPKGETTVTEYGGGLRADPLSANVGTDTVRATCALTDAANGTVTIPTVDEIDSVTDMVIWKIFMEDTPTTVFLPNLDDMYSLFLLLATSFHIIMTMGLEHISISH